MKIVLLIHDSIDYKHYYIFLVNLLI